jgi:hypothetical protein
MSFPSMSIQRLVKLSSIIVNPIVTQHFCRHESREASPAELFQTYYLGHSFSHFDQIRWVAL